MRISKKPQDDHTSINILSSAIGPCVSKYDKNDKSKTVASKQLKFEC